MTTITSGVLAVVYVTDDDYDATTSGVLGLL